MTEKLKFFFEPDLSTDDSGLSNQENANTFFSALKDSGVIQEAPLEDLEMKRTEVLASMKKMENKYLSIEFGVYQDNYAVHVTPVNSYKNLTNDVMVKRACTELATILNEYVPYTLRVDLYLPRAEWKLKVISAVVLGGATAWNFDPGKLEAEGILKMFKAIEKIILGG